MQRKASQLVGGGRILEMVDSHPWSWKQVYREAASEFKGVVRQYGSRWASVRMTGI